MADKNFCPTTRSPPNAGESADKNRRRTRASSTAASACLLRKSRRRLSPATFRQVPASIAACGCGLMICSNP